MHTKPDKFIDFHSVKNFDRAPPIVDHNHQHQQQQLSSQQ